MMNNNAEKAKMRRIRDLIDLLACLLGAWFIALFIDCAALFSQFDSNTTPVVLMIVLAVLFIAEGTDISLGLVEHYVGIPVWSVVDYGLTLILHHIIFGIDLHSDLGFNTVYFKITKRNFLFRASA